jgi:biotin transport system substrate-specific component
MSRNATPADLRSMVRSALFTALIISGAYIRVPIGPVPIALSSFFVLLAGLLLGPHWATVSVATYLLLGAIGLPVFTAGGGAALFAGPTGGYLVGYLAAAFCTGLIADQPNPTILRDVAALVCGTITIYALGVVWLYMILQISLRNALSLGVVPFLPGDAVKIGGALGVRFFIKKYAPDLLQSVDKRGKD